MRLDTYGKDDSFSNGMNIAICESNIAKYTETDYTSVYNGNTTQSEDDFIKGYYCFEDLLRCQKAKFKINLSI